MPIRGVEKLGIEELLTADEENVAVSFQIARSITKNVCVIKTSQDALDYIFTHINDTSTLLLKRHITKEILFNYLHKRKVQVEPGFTKLHLVLKIKEYWNSFEGLSKAVCPFPKYLTPKTEELSRSECPTPEKTYESPFREPYKKTKTCDLPQETLRTEPPIHLLARQFSEWFFENYNKNALKIEDFWSDAALKLDIQSDDRVECRESVSSESIMGALRDSKTELGLLFNPNLMQTGVQGRMDAHGLVLVLVCGTLHTEQNCVGVFESLFGLLRDPFAENNWKIKKMYCVLRSKGSATMPMLKDSITLKEAMELPIPTGELT